MYFTGLANFSSSRGAFLYCFCFDFCLVDYTRRLFLVGLETIPVFILCRYLIKYELKKSIFLALLIGFVFESILAGLLSMFGVLFFVDRFVIGELEFPIYVAVDRMFYIGIIYAIVLVLFRGRLKK